MLDPPSGIYNDIIKCGSPFNTGPMTYVLRASIAALEHVGRRRHPAAEGAAHRRRPATTAAPFALDADGNVKGGIRTPQVDAPVATLSGLGQTGTNFCGIFGTTKPFDAATLAAKYPTPRRVREGLERGHRQGGEGRLRPPRRRQRASRPPPPQSTVGGS